MSCQQINIDIQQTEVTCLEVRTHDSCTILEPRRTCTLEIVSRGPQGPPGPGFGSDFVLSETPAGAIDDLNTVYVTSDDFNKIWVYLNGLRMKEGSDYNVTGSNEITFTYAPWTGATLLVDYVVPT